MNESHVARRQATLNLSTAEELRQLLDFTPELIAVLGPNRERIYANRWALTFLGVSLEEWRLFHSSPKPPSTEYSAPVT